MNRAIRLARRGVGHVEPNPAVGCVIVRGDRIVGEGWHQRFGGPHAEVNALRDAGPAARGATAYVTLEPCRHFGKTPPCVDALIDAGIRRVVIGTRDPHRTSGGGIALLRRAGVEVELGVFQKQADALLAPFAKVVTRGLPYVTCKWAATLDGAIATRAGDSQWISCPQSRRIVHRLRARVDAVVVGVGTAIKDDPMLTARDVRVKRIARRVVVDPTLRIALKSKLVATAEEAPVLIACGSPAGRSAKAARLRERGVEVVAINARARGRLDIETLLRHLVRDHAATNVLVEGGSATTGAFIEQGLADELLVFIGPRIVGDSGAIHPVTVPNPPKTIAGGVGAELIELRRVGPDAMLRYRL